MTLIIYILGILDPSFDYAVIIFLAPIEGFRKQYLTVWYFSLSRVVRRVARNTPFFGFWADDAIFDKKKG